MDPSVTGSGLAQESSLLPANVTIVLKGKIASRAEDGADERAPGLVPTRRRAAREHVPADRAGRVFDPKLGGKFLTYLQQLGRSVCLKTSVIHQRQFPNSTQPLKRLVKIARTL